MANTDRVLRIADSLADITAHMSGKATSLHARRVLDTEPAWRGQTYTM